MIIKDKLRFEWDHNKDRTNQKKHFVSFKKAKKKKKKQYFQRKRNGQ